MLHVGVRKESIVENPASMRRDDAAVGGFFEDLPVLVLVLCGVATIISASVWSYGHIADERLDEELEGVAQRFADRLVEAALQAEGGEHPSLDRLRALNVSRLAAGLPEGIGYAVSVAEIYPSFEWLLNALSGEKPVSTDASASSRLVNAIDAWSRVVVVEVRAIVW